MQKTHYELDLETKDRKPDIVPKVGDKVKIKSRMWYEKWKNEDGYVKIGPTFTPKMKCFFGGIYTVRSINRCGYFYLEGDEDRFSFSLDMFEEVYPQESSKENKNLTLYDSASSDRIDSLSVLASAIHAINPIQGIGISYDLGTLSRQGAGLEAWPEPLPRITLPQSCFGSTSAVVHQNCFTGKEPELQTIKKHRFIKLENL